MSKLSSSKIRVRMYRHGFGDCFLLTIPRTGGRDFQMLIDCGLIQGTPNAKVLIEQVIDDIIKTTKVGRSKPKLDVFVVTHEHWDHLSGVAQFQDKFNSFDIDKVWMAWTEDPTDPDARQIRADRHIRLTALRNGLAHLQTELAANGHLDADSEHSLSSEFAQLTELLSFYGIETDELQEPDAVGVAGSSRIKTLRIAEAMDWCSDRDDAKRRFFRPGDSILGDELNIDKSIKRIYVLGPPTDRKLLYKDKPSRQGRETYGVESALQQADRAFFGADLGIGGAPGTEFEMAAPFDPKYRIPVDQAKETDFFKTHYFDEVQRWRSIEGVGLFEAGEFAMNLDGDTNNTSLALAIELQDGRVLLFPGDAQVGNWESWHADSTDKPLIWKTDEAEVNAKALLNRTVLYKVGHHASHNATLSDLGLEMMTSPDLVAFAPVDTYVAHRKGWDEIPYIPLLRALHSHAKGRVIVADRPLAAMSEDEKRFPKNMTVEDATTLLTVEIAPDEITERPLYVDIYLT